jgi:hypothetical protein
MGFLIFGDIIAIWLFPALLACVGFGALYGYNQLLIIMGFKLDYSLLMIGYWVVTALIWLLATKIGTQSPHLRDTPTGLMSYLVQFMKFMLVIFFVGLGIHFSLSLAFRAGNVQQAASDGIGALCLLAGSLVMYRLAIRAFLWGPTPGAEREHVRGQDLDAGDNVTSKAWRDV